MGNESRFDGKAAVYDAARPGYAPALMAHLACEEGFAAGTRVADVGSGTGRFSEQLLELGCIVEAVEPNDQMRAVAEARLGERAEFSSTAGSAERTGLADASVDRVCAAQAFHWMDPQAFRRECRRILRPGGAVALVWNFRDPASPLVRASAAVCARHCPGFTGFSGGMDFDGDAVARFFEGAYRTVSFPHDLAYDRKGFVDRMLSASYAPDRDDPAHAAYAADFERLFDEHAQAGVLVLPNSTAAYIGEVA